MRTSSKVKIRAHWCVLGISIALFAAQAVSAQKKLTEQEADMATSSTTISHEKDDPRARAQYLEKRRSGGQPVPRGARLRAMREQQQMMQNEGKRFWEHSSADSVAAITSESASAVPETTAAAPERSSTPLPLSSSQWVFIGPQPTNSNPANSGGGAHLSGRVTALAVDPTNPNIVYLGAAQGGVWKTTDGGTHWIPLTDNQPSLAVGSIVLDPQNPQIIYVGTGEENFGSDSYYGVGILKSIDGGASWTNVASAAAFSGISEPESTCASSEPASGCGGPKIGSLAASNQSGTTVLLATVERGFTNTGGLYRSVDGGASWNLVTGIATEGGIRYTADSVVFAGPTSAVAYAGIHTHANSGVLQGVYKSTNAGLNWTQVNSGITVSGTGRVTVATAASDGGQTTYAALDDDNTSNLSGLYLTTNGGATWAKQAATPDFCGTQSGGGAQQCFYDMMVSVSPTNAQLVVVGGAGFPLTQFVLHSINGGASWIDDSSNIHADQHAGAFASDGSFYIGNDGGSYKTPGLGSGAATWTELNSTLGITQFYGYFAIDPSNSQLAYGGTQDNGTQQFVNDMAWNEITCGDGAGAVIDSNTGRVFANCNDIDVRESDTGSAGSFSHVDTTLVNSGDKSGFIPPLVGDHSNPQRIYFGTTRVWQAQSASSPTWTVISPQLTGSTSKTIANMDVSDDGTTMYSVSEDGKVFKGTNLLTGVPAFTDVTNTGFPAGNYITAVRLSPTDNSTAYISLSGFNAGQHIYKSTGGSWTNITGNLPNAPVNDLVLDPDIPGVIYAATDIGVFSATENGPSTTWTTLQTMLPNVAVLGLRLHRASRTLRAATHGRGMWDLYVPACNPAVGPCLKASPNGVNFGSVALGTSATQSITVTNIGTGNLVVMGVTLAGSDFNQSNSCGTLAQNATCNINVTFTPRAGLTRTGSVTIFSNSGVIAKVALTGVGLVVPVNDSLVTPITVTSLPVTASVITNGATSDANDPIPSAACVGVYAPNSQGLTPIDALGYDPSPSFNHHSIWFYYTPKVTGTIDLDTLQSVGIDTVLSVWTGGPGAWNPETACNDDQGGNVKQSQIVGMPVTPGTTYKIMVTGYYVNDFGNIVLHIQQSSGSATTGSPLTLSASSLNFTALLGRPSAAQNLTITNNSASGTTVNLAVSGDYSLSNNCAGSLGAGLSCTATVTLTPSVVGQRNSVLTVTDSVTGSPQTIPLNGMAFNFALSNPRPHRSARNGSVVQGQRQEFDVALDMSAGGNNVPVNLSCANVPMRAACSASPTQITATDGSTNVMVTLQTSAALKGYLRSGARRLDAGTPLGDYNLKVTARVGSAETSTSIPVSVIAPARAIRISR